MKWAAIFFFSCDFIFPSYVCPAMSTHDIYQKINYDLEKKLIMWAWKKRYGFDIKRRNLLHSLSNKSNEVIW